MNRRGRNGFTLIELLVTIGIITVLAAILVPVISYVRITAQNAASQALVQKIATAINIYQHEFNAYPGILPDSYFPGGGGGANPWSDSNYTNLTQTEDMVLALLGGINMQPFPNGKLVVQNDYIGTGPLNLNPINPKALGKPFIDRRNEELVPDFNNPLYRQDSMPQFTYIANAPYPDTKAPEFLDQFAGEDRRPILYMRAIRGAKPTNIVRATYNKDYVYNFSTISMYMGPRDQLNATTMQTYLTNSLGQAKYSGSFILIGAGIDHIYGTPDDTIVGGGGGQ